MTIVTDATTFWRALLDGTSPVGVLTPPGMCCVHPLQVAHWTDQLVDRGLYDRDGLRLTESGLKVRDPALETLWTMRILLEEPEGPRCLAAMTVAPDVDLDEPCTPAAMDGTILLGWTDTDVVVGIGCEGALTIERIQRNPPADNVVSVTWSSNDVVMHRVVSDDESRIEAFSRNPPEER